MILAIPKEEARQIIQELNGTGIRGVWNFAHTDLHLPDDIVVENVHLSESLMQLSYRLKHMT